MYTIQQLKENKDQYQNRNCGKQCKVVKWAYKKIGTPRNFEML